MKDIDNPEFDRIKNNLVKSQTTPDQAIDLSDEFDPRNKQGMGVRTQRKMKQLLESKGGI